MFKERTQNLRTLFSFLLLLNLMIFVMMVIGAITRLTESGLSIVEWRLIGGFLPPFKEGEWIRAFSLYQQTEQYQAINFGISLDEFKNIFWWEYFHRLWGRLIGIAFIVGFIYLIAKKSISVPMFFKLLGLLLLGAIQAFLGWWIVNNSLDSDAYVEAYRLMVHLGFAFILWGCLIAMLTGVYNEMNWRYCDNSHIVARFLSSVLALLVFFMVLSGALVAGLKGGLIHNDWPLMSGSLIPTDYFAPLSVGFWDNAINNPAAAQFHHRWFAFFILAVIVFYKFVVPKYYGMPKQAKASANILLAAVILQIILGIATLILVMPVALAVAHHIGAALVFAACIIHWRHLRAIG